MKTKNRHSLWYRLLHAVHFGLVGLLAYSSVAAVLLLYIVSPVWLKPAHAAGYGIFGNDSFWNSVLPQYPSLNPSSDSIVQLIATQAQSGGTNYDTTSLSNSVYTVDASVPTAPVLPWDCDGSGVNPGLATMWQAVPIPYYAAPGSGGGMTIYQPSTQTVWEFDHAQQSGGQWQACHGGRITGTGSSAGIFPSGYGTTDASLPVIGGQISISEWQSGFIGHAVGLNVAGISGAGLSWPASSTRGMPEGLRLQLDPSVNVDSLGLSSAGRAVAKAAQKYGFIVWNSSSQVGVVGESPVSNTSRGLGNPYGGSISGALAGFPWSRLRALPTSYGQSAVVPGIDSFTASASAVQANQQVSFGWQAHDVDSCTIPGVVNAAPASGSATTGDIASDSSYTLTCVGPYGSSSRNLSVSVSGIAENSVTPGVDSTTIDTPVSGTATVLAELATPEAAKTVQKVVYYEKGKLLSATATPPFGLDTRLMRDGKHVITVHIYYKDGHESEATTTINVANFSQTLLTPLPLPGPGPGIVGPVLTSFGALGAFSVMGAMSWYGWRRVHV